jgi:hypothetical protein
MWYLHTTLLQCLQCIGTLVLGADVVNFAAAGPPPQPPHHQVITSRVRKHAQSIADHSSFPTSRLQPQSDLRTKSWETWEQKVKHPPATHHPPSPKPFQNPFDICCFVICMLFCIFLFFGAKRDDGAVSRKDCPPLPESSYNHCMGLLMMLLPPGIKPAGSFPGSSYTCCMELLMELSPRAKQSRRNKAASPGTST